jgi:hypothetical protein
MAKYAGGRTELVEEIYNRYGIDSSEVIRALSDDDVYVAVDGVLRDYGIYAESGEEFAKGGLVYLYYGGEEHDEVAKASSEEEANEIAMKKGAEHWEYVEEFAKGGRVNLEELSGETYRMAERSKKDSKKLYDISDDLADVTLGNKKIKMAKGGDVSMFKGKVVDYVELEDDREQSISVVFTDNTELYIWKYGDAFRVRYYERTKGGVLGKLWFKENGVKRYAKGGKTDDNWIQEAEKDMEKKGTVGLFTKEAKKRGLTPVQFAKKVLKNPSYYTDKLRKQAQFVKNTNPEKFGKK